MYPELAIREIFANAIVHQDLDQSGASIMVEIYSDRIEFTNPGQPLVGRNGLLIEDNINYHVCEEM